MRTPDMLKTIVFIVLTFITSASIAADSPEDAFTSFHNALVAADLDEMLKYAPEAQKAEMDALPDEQKKATIEFMARLTPKEMTILGQVPGASPDELTLYAEGMGIQLMSDKPEKMYATAQMLKESGEWKVGKSEWNNKRPDGLDKAKTNIVAAAETPPTEEAAEPTELVSATPEEAVEPAESLSDTTEEAVESTEPLSATAETAPAEPAPAPATPATDAVEETPALTVASPEPQEAEKPKEQCTIKPVMTDAEIETCRRVAENQ